MCMSSVINLNPETLYQTTFSLHCSSCLRSWLEQDTSCPTCRTSLNEGQEQDPNGNMPNERGAAGNAMPDVMPQPPANNQATTNHFFHFDGMVIFNIQAKNEKYCIKIIAWTETSQTFVAPAKHSGT